MTRTIAVCMLVLASAARAQPDPGRVVVDALASHDIVLLSEEHWGVQFHGFVHELLADSRLAGHVNDIVVECGNPRYQGVIDRYVAGEDVPLSELRPAWRNTSQILAWDSPLYESLYTWVRTVNRGLKPEERYRIVAMEPPIDWTKVRTAADYQPFAQRSRDQLARVESEVLAKHRKAIIIIVGGAHVLRRSLRDPKRIVAIQDASLGDALGRKYPGRTFSVWTVPANEGEPGPVPRIVNVAGTSLAARSFGEVAPIGIMVQRVVNGKQEWVSLADSDWPPIGDMCDALLYLPPNRTKAEPPQSVYADESYYREVLRRARIMSQAFGFDLVQELQEAAGKAGKP